MCGFEKEMKKETKGAFKICSMLPAIFTGDLLLGFTWGPVDEVATCNLVNDVHTKVDGHERHKPVPVRSEKHRDCARLEHRMSGVQGEELYEDQETLASAVWYVAVERAQRLG
jgi:hypothetical protein